MAKTNMWRFSLHVPLEKWVDAPQKAKAQFADDPGMPVVTVDLGVNRLAVMGAFLNDQLMATKFIHGRELNHQRHRILNVIANKRSQSGRLPANVQDIVDLWEKRETSTRTQRGRLPARSSISPLPTKRKGLCWSIFVDTSHPKNG